MIICNWLSAQEPPQGKLNDCTPLPLFKWDILAFHIYFPVPGRLDFDEVKSDNQNQKVLWKEQTLNIHYKSLNIVLRVVRLLSIHNNSSKFIKR